MKVPSLECALVSDGHTDSGPKDVRPARRSGGIALRFAFSVGAGWLLFLSFPPRTLWFLAPVAIALLTVVLQGRSLRAGFGFGYAAGLGFFMPLLPWVGAYVGATPWLALASIEAVAFGVFGVLAVAVGRAPLYPVWIAGAWVTTEALRSRVPFGGFPWGRLAFGQADSPLLPLTAIAGAPGLSFVTALTGTLLAWSLAGTSRVRWQALMKGGTAIVLVFVSAFVVSSPEVTPDEVVTATVVQGNVPRLGLDFNAQRRAVLDNHVARTEQLAAEVTAGRAARPRLVIWPENASDIDPLTNRDAADRLDRAARSIGAPILVGTVLQGEPGTSINSAMVWDPTDGPGQQHIKRQLVPFGEYLPLRSIVRAVSSYADAAGNFIAGNGNGVVDLNGVHIAVATCYEVAFDDLVTESVKAGATVIAVPTNNATFGRTEMTFQQLAMSRVRAVEHGRSVLIAATSGVSAIITPTGVVRQQSEIFTAQALTDEIAVRSDLTLATRVGSIPELALSAIVLSLATSALFRGMYRVRRGERTRT
ncbi:MAG: apolipoprotein N-acyltransferase [Rhodococcus qingshengii]